MVTPKGGRPDFVFPSETAYLDPNFPHSQIRMLAVKTSCRDRWRQVLNEIDRPIQWKHLLTVQEGVSEAQCNEMTRAGVKRVVPEPLQSKFPRPVRAKLQTLASFIEEVRNLDPNPSRQISEPSAVTRRVAVEPE